MIPLIKRRLLPLFLLLVITVCLGSRARAAVSLFDDVASPANYYYIPVRWAADQGITTGIAPNTFAPNATCTRGQIITFLWRAAGQPAPASVSSPFTDLNSQAFYYRAVLWAVDTGITNGTTSTTFEPDKPCTRGQVVTFLWRALGTPAASQTSHPFTDVNADAFYYPAMLWAVQNDITNGMTATTFAPNGLCVRGQIVTFLYRAYAQKDATTPANAAVYYNGQRLNISSMFYHNGRLYVNQAQLEQALHKTANTKPNLIAAINGHISLVDITRRYRLSINISQENNRIDLYNMQTATAQPSSGSRNAYIRWEDVMANGLNAQGKPIANATYSSQNLEKLRFMGQHMATSGQQFYVAWIPVYVNPAAGVTNDVSRNPCLYNADFIYTLDYLRMCGGHIVLHGYTHQQFNTASSVGNEFGADSEFSQTQMAGRMDKAMMLSARLGFEADCFEFPHYSSTAASRALAEERFDVIYQAAEGHSSQPYTVARGQRRIVYLPTPADYIHSRYDTEYLNRINQVHTNGALMSLFYHPTLDFSYISVSTVNGVRQCRMSSNDVILLKVTAHISNLGYSFQHYSA